MSAFQPINPACSSVFQPEKLSLGLVVPIENYGRSITPAMQQHVQRALLAETLGFKAIWVRDVPFNVPSFGDAGQMFDPFTYLGYLAAHTQRIALGIASIALPLHHPVHVAKSAATIDQLSGGRLLMGVASGDRFQEYPAMAIDYDSRGEQFRDAFAYIRHAAQDFPTLSTRHCGELSGSVDVLPKPYGTAIPMLITGNSRQALQWNVDNADGWMSYPRSIDQQQHVISQWRGLLEKSEQPDKPFMQPLYVDLLADDDAPPQPIHLGLATGVHALVRHLHALQNIGVNHVALNLRFNQRDIETTLEQLSNHVLPHFHTHTTPHTTQETP